MPDQAENVTLIEPGRGGLLGTLSECWHHRELLYFLAWRDINVRYKQTVLGAAWAVLQPVVTMLVFTLVFNRMAGVEAPDGTPYPIFSYTGLLPWLLFQAAVVRSSQSLVTEARLITKVYFPRLLVPLSAAVSALVDFAIAFVILLGMMAYYGVRPTWTLALVPVFVVLAILAAMSVSIWLSMLNAKYRDFRYTLPFVVRIWMFLSPVAYGTSMLLEKIPTEWGWVYMLNPMTGVIEGFRWALLGKSDLRPEWLLGSTGVALAVFVAGLFYFRRAERVLVDML